MTDLAGWTPGHRPTRCLQLPNGDIEITWHRHGMPHCYQSVTAEQFARLQQRRTYPPIETPNPDPMEAA